MAAITLTNGKTWASQKAAKTHFKDILHAYPDGAVVDDAGHHDDLVALVGAVRRGPSDRGAEGICGHRAVRAAVEHGGGLRNAGVLVGAPER